MSTRVVALLLVFALLATLPLAGCPGKPKPVEESTLPNDAAGAAGGPAGNEAVPITNAEGAVPATR